MYLANEIASRTTLRLMGIQGYEGHLQLLTDETERKRLCAESMEKLMGTTELLRNFGHKISVITTGGTGTSEYCAAAGANEVQPGKYKRTIAIQHWRQSRNSYQATLTRLSIYTITIIATAAGVERVLPISARGKVQ